MLNSLKASDVNVTKYFQIFVNFSIRYFEYLV